MKKKVFGRKLSRGEGARRSLYRSLVKSLVENGSITTTDAKAKSVVPFVNKLVNVGKKGDLASRRRVYSKLANDRVTADLLVDKIIPTLKGKTDGYLRLIHLPTRRGDRAKMVGVEWKRVENTKESEENNVEKKVKKVNKKETKEVK